MGERAIWIDGQLVQRSPKLLDTGGSHSFTLGSHSGCAVIPTSGLSVSYDLILDGRSLTTGQTAAPDQPIPSWAWLFIIACIVIPVIALRSLIRGMIGIAGGYSCLTIARSPRYGIGTRMTSCILITVVCVIIVGMSGAAPDAFRFGKAVG